jgi:gluconate 2-dehydrogenase subunit 3-like protein
MKSFDEDQNANSRRAFLLSGGGWLSGAWIAAHLPGIAAAAHHAEQMPAKDSGAQLQFFDAREAADVEALCSQIVPSGATPGAREAHAMYFIDCSLATYFAAMAPDYRKGLAEFQSLFLASNPAHPFGAASPQIQTAFLKTADRTPFFETTRMLTVLGMFSSPKYGGNYQGAGWKLMGFVDQHAFAPPFGYYDAEYKGFVPYPLHEKDGPSKLVLLHREVERSSVTGEPVKFTVPRY